MKVLFDHQIFELQKIGGVSRYFVELYKHLNLQENTQIDIACSYSNNIYLKDYHKFSNIDFQKGKNVILKTTRNKFFRGLNKRYTKKKISAQEFDILHPTYYGTYFLSQLEKPFVLTVFDMIHEIYHQGLGKNDITIENKKHLCNQATKIIAISNSTKQDLIKIFGIQPEKIIVTHLAGGFEKPLVKKNSEELGLPDKYILFVGSRYWYKNFNRFFEAALPLLKEDKTLHIICTGSKFNQEEQNLFKKHNVEQQVIQYFCQDKDFYYLYNNALLFVFPSEYEGFGIPTLEAFSADCPALISNTSSLPEVGGDAALYFDPLRVENIRDKIKEVLFDSNLRKRMVENGQVQLQKFNWERTADETKKVYDQVYLKI